MNNTVYVVGRSALLLGLVLMFAKANAADVYVSTLGSDSNPGTVVLPYRTITYAYSKASAGTTVHVAPGVYSDYSSGWGIHLGKSGTSANPIVVKSDIRGGAIIDGQNLADRNQGFYIDGNYNVVDGFEIRNCTSGGMSIWANYNRIINNEIHHNGNPASSSTNGKDGIYSNQGTSGNYYCANSVHDNGRTGSNLDHGMYLCGQNETVINNLLYRNAATGLQVAGYTTVRNMIVYNNVVAWNGTTGIILWMSLSGVDIKNNIVYKNGNYGIGSYDAHGSGVVMDHNLIYGNGGGTYNFTGGGSDYTYSLGSTITSDPQFVNGTSAAFDGHLSATSPARAAGLNLFALVPTDKDGTVRSSSGAWDLGAYGSLTGNLQATPLLRTVVQGSTIQVVWPTNAGSYVVQSKAMTPPTSSWSDVTTTPTISQGQNMLSFPISAGGKLFRLRPL